MLALALAAASLTCAQDDARGDNPKLVVEPVSEVVPASRVEWEALNPARGGRSPRAGALWGDRTGSGASGFLVRFTEEFASPPHIHNVLYRGVVIQGLVHNDDPDARKMWMPTGSFWTQPAGEAHITAAGSTGGLAYIEIDEGPYLVRATSEAFDSGDHPVQLHASNLAWTPATSIAWVDPGGTPDSRPVPEVAFLTHSRSGTPKDERSNRTLIKLPVGFQGTLRSHAATFRAVVIQGRFGLEQPKTSRAGRLEPGSYFGSRGEAVHRVSCEVEAEIESKASAECLLYVRAEGSFEIDSYRP